MAEERTPTFDEMMNPLLDALNELGGSGTIDEINNKVFEIMKITESILDIPHGEEGGISEVEYRLAWTRTYLKKYGLIENSSRGVWAFTLEGRQTKKVDEKEVVREVRRRDKADKEKREIDEELEPEDNWINEIIKIVQEISPSAFEKLIQRILRESGFTQVEITGKSGDGGIDGSGIMRLGDLLSFHVMFQCKRYKDIVSANVVRDFRGALSGRADKGLLITTGRFTRDAIQEATRDGATPIDLIDGDRLAELLKKYSLGVDAKIVEVEEVEIDKKWFNSFN